jgi:hypothetical protein
VGCLVLHICCSFDSSIIRAFGGHKCVSLVGCEDQLSLYIWSVPSVLLVFEMLIRLLDLDVRTRLDHREYFEVHRWFFSSSLVFFD